MHMKKVKYFDYEKLAKEIKLPKIILNKIKSDVRKEFPSNDMLFELHMIRAIDSKYWEKYL